MINKNWTRWIQASLTQYFSSFFTGANQVTFLVEPWNREAANTDKDYIEQRWNGPFIREYSRALFCVEVDVNFVINSQTNRDDTYTHKQVVGIVQSAMVSQIPVFKYGTGIDDDQTLLECLLLKVSHKSGVFTNYFGRQQDGVEVEQSTVEAAYEMILKG